MSGGIHAYLKKMARLTGRKKSPKLVKKSAPIMLPQEVQHAVDSARYMARTPTQNGPRVIVSMVGLGRLVVQDTTIWKRGFCGHGQNWTRHRWPA